MVLKKILLIAFFLFTGSDQSNAKTLRFDDFPASVIQPSYIVKPRIISAQDRLYRSALQHVDLSRPIFAGHYAFFHTGCGTSCLVAAAIDIRSGYISWLPFTISAPGDAPIDWQPLEYRLDSTLLIVNGGRNEIGDGRYFYNFHHDHFYEVPK